MKEGTRAMKCPKCKEPANINEMDFAQCANDDCDISWYLPVPKWNTKVRFYLLTQKDVDL